MDPATSLVLITGISGFLGAEVAVQFLRAGFKIRGTVRKQTQADAFLLMYGEEFPGMIEVVIVERLDVKDAFEKAVKDVTAIMHIASPLPLIAKDNEKEILIPAIEGVLEILRSAAKEPSVKSFVLTSSIAAFMNFMRMKGPEYTLKETDCNDMTYDVAKRLPLQQGFLVYTAAKALAERAAWDFLESEKPGFTLTTIAPCWVFGPSSQAGITKLSETGSSFGLAFSSLVGIKRLPPTMFDDYVDVRDCARAHVGVVLHPEAAGKRYILAAGRMNNSLCASILRREFPAEVARIPDEPVQPFKPTFQMDSTPAEKAFGFKYVSLETSIRDQFLHLFSLAAE